MIAQEMLWEIILMRKVTDLFHSYFISVATIEERKAYTRAKGDGHCHFSQCNGGSGDMTREEVADCGEE
jgi:hypothetical protein